MLLTLTEWTVSGNERREIEYLKNNPDLYIIREEPEEDCLGGVSHEAFPLEGCLLQEPGQSPGVVQVKVRDQKEVDLVSLDHVNKGEGVHASETGVDATVKHDLLVLEGNDVTRPSHLLTGTHRSDLHQIRLLRGRQSCRRHDNTCLES